MNKKTVALGILSLATVLGACADFSDDASLGHQGATLLTIDFDYGSDGLEIAHDAAIDEQYAGVGVHFDGTFRIARRTVSFPEYDNTTTLNLVCTPVGASNGTCTAPPDLYDAVLVVDLDMPVEFASIEGRTRADCVYDADGLQIEAYDAMGGFLGSGTAYGNNNPAPYCTEATLTASVAVAGIRRIVVRPIDTDTLDNLVLGLPDPDPTPTPTASPSPSPTATAIPTPTPVPQCPVDVKITPSTINLNANGQGVGVRICDLCEGETPVESTLGISTPGGAFEPIDLSRPHGPSGPSCYRFFVDRKSLSSKILAELGWTPGNGGDTTIELSIEGETAPSGAALVGSDVVRVINP